MSSNISSGVGDLPFFTTFFLSVIYSVENSTVSMSHKIQNLNRL